MIPVSAKARVTICALYKHSQTALPDETECLADSGYQGLLNLHEKAKAPFKKPKGSELTAEQKQFNKELAAQRVVIEHILRHLKIFRIVAGKYRNRRSPIYAANEFDCRIV